MPTRATYVAVSGFNFAVALVVFTALAAAPVLAERTAAGGLEERRALRIERLFPGEGDSVGLAAEVGALLPQQRVALGLQLRGQLLTFLSPRLLSEDAVAALGPWAARVLAPAVAVAKAQQPEEVLAALAAQDLDHAIPIPMEAFQLAHGSAMAEPVPGTTTPRAVLMATDRAKPATWTAAALQTPGYVVPEQTEPMAELLLLAPGDPVPAGEVPDDSVEEGPYGFFLTGHFVVPAPAHVLANSGRLARALNELAGDRARLGPLPVRGTGRRFVAATPGELVDGLRSQGGYDVSVHDARMYLDLFDYYVRRGDDLLAVRFPTWFACALDPAAPYRPPAPDAPPLLLPADHSEHLVVLWNRGTCEPQALVKWYMGIPDGPRGQPMRFGPATRRTSSWAGYRVLQSYGAPRDVRRMVEAAATLMRFQGFVQRRHQLPLAGYGSLAVCNDSTALLETVLRGSPQRVELWGLARDPGYEFYLAPWAAALGLDLQPAADGRLVLGIPSDAYPGATPWAARPAALLGRLGSSVATRRPAALRFPDVRSTVERLARVSPDFRQALAR